MNLARAAEVFPHATPGILGEIAQQAGAYGILTTHEAASFLAQYGYETAGFTRYEENLSYSIARLMQVWPKRFATAEAAMPYAYNPQALAEKVYGGRMGNDQPGDGYKFRGRGPQLTGKNNYAKISRLVGMDLVTNPDLVLKMEIGVRIACAWWQAEGLNKYADQDDVREETHIINGGETGLAGRQANLDALLKVLDPAPAGVG